MLKPSETFLKLQNEILWIGVVMNATLHFIAM